MDSYQGRWELVPEETTGFEEFSDSIGAPKQGREAFKKLVYVVTYSKEGDNWRVKAEVKGLGQPKEYVWTPDVEFEYEGLDGSKMKSTITWDGSKCQEKHASESGQWTSTRLVDGDVMTVTSDSNGVSMVQKFKRV